MIWLPSYISCNCKNPTRSFTFRQSSVFQTGSEHKSPWKRPVRSTLLADGPSQEAGHWPLAVALTIVCAALTVTGMILQKKAVSAPQSVPEEGLRQPPRLGEMVCTPLWLMGFVFSVVLPVPLQIFTYGLAPMSLLAPLGSIHVLLNLAVTPWLLQERRQLCPDLPASLFILVGTGLTTTSGQHREVDYDFQDLLHLASDLPFLCALGFLVFVVLCSLAVMLTQRAQIEASAKERPDNPRIRDVLLPALVACGFGGIANIMLKCLGELIKEQAGVLKCGVCLLLAALPGAAQLNFINGGLRLYPQLVFFPIYSAILILVTTCFGLVFFQEYGSLLAHTGRLVVFILGVVFVCLGIVSFTMRRGDPVVPRVAVEMESSGEDKLLGT
ncbi:unnamed protein product [Polarella glacialis]|uniref:Magnesium transporter n=1 Tax=Polarella glacialis TaxID=89957 RepID=A0A813EKD1_POLGL|nr:unnamed protein product [Polarella glacialis]